MSEEDEGNPEYYACRSKYYAYRVQDEIRIALDEFLKGKISEEEYKEIVDMYKFRTE